MAEIDCGDRYEFDAPSHVVDLEELQIAASGDQWFEQQTSGANGHLQTTWRSDCTFGRSPAVNLPRAIVAPQVKTDTDSDPSTTSAVPSNIVTSWGPESPARTGARPKRSCTNPSFAQPRRVSERKQITSGPAPPSKKRKMPNSSEEQELERIKNLQKEVALHRKKNEASYKAALAGKPLPPKMVPSATVPKEFNFNSGACGKATTSSSTDHKEVDFINQLRKPTSPAKALKGATVPKPFNLSTGHKRGAEQPAAYVPMAQQIEQFQKRTPDRYHLRSRRSREKGPAAGKGGKLKLTQPHTPNLMTRQRSRPVHVKSSAELEAEEVEKLNKFKFSALELNRKILENAECLKRPAVKEPTVPEGFELQVEKRLHERRTTKKPQEGEEKPCTFKAQQLPKKILEGVVGLPEKKVLYPTVPESPAFARKKRVRLEPKVEEVKQPSPIKAPPVPHFGLPFKPQLQENHHVEVCPFSFEERDRERRALKEKKLEEKRNGEVPQFKAQPLPDFDTVVLPEKKKLEPTKPEPFRLLLDERGAVKSSRFDVMLKEDQKKEEAIAFKARPNTVTHKEPFQPKKEARAPVVVEAFALSTARRALERQEYGKQVSEKEALRMLMEEEQRREEERKQKEEIARLRQEQVHVAQPIRHYKPVAVKKSEVPLTIPQSPKFCDRFRL